MGVKNPVAAEYISALKKLYPRGDYWDTLLTDDNSDISLICAARADELVVFRERMSALQKESYPYTADELIPHWEHTYLAYTNDTLTLDQRRNLLLAQKNGSVCIDAIKKIAKTYGCEIHTVEHPYTSSTFAHSFFGRSYMTLPASLAVLFIHATVPQLIRNDFESAIERILLANQILFFFYGGE